MLCPLTHFHLRPLAGRDHAAVLALNAACQPDLTRLEADDLSSWLSRVGTHWVAADSATDVPVGYLLSFAHDADYAGEAMQALRRELAPPFTYIAQVALAPEHRRAGLGRALYATAFHAASAPLLCADVNLRPPNESSYRFHLRLDFCPLAEFVTPEGHHAALLARPPLPFTLASPLPKCAPVS